MMSRYDIPCPPTLLMALFAADALSYETGISIDEGPVLNIANMSPGWNSCPTSFFSSARTSGVSMAVKCRSSTISTKMRPAVSAGGLARGRMMPSGGAGRCRRGGCRTLKTRPPWTITSEATSCGDAVFEHLEVVLAEVRHELAVGRRAGSRRA